jgi:hypothetical protein
MKRIYLLVALFVAFAANSFAQRSINLKCTMASPAANATITSGSPITVDAVVTNLGPDSLKMSDTTLYYLTINNAPVTITSGSSSGAYWIRWNRSLKVNDTMHITYSSLTFTYGSKADSQRTICMNVLPYKDVPANDTIADPDKTNNSGCVTTTWKANPTSVEDFNNTSILAGANSSALYPNPASDVVNVAIALNYTTEVSVKVMDLSGRVVMSVENGKMSKGDHTVTLNTASLKTGLYLYQVIMGNEVSNGKLMIAK